MSKNVILIFVAAIAVVGGIVWAMGTSSSPPVEVTPVVTAPTTPPVTTMAPVETPTPDPTPPAAVVETPTPSPDNSVDGEQTPGTGAPAALSP